jgi:hypothetical protein
MPVRRGALTICQQRVREQSSMLFRTSSGSMNTHVSSSGTSPHTPSEGSFNWAAIERGEAMLGWVKVVLLTIGLGGFVVAFVSWEIYVREGGVPTRPWFHAQRTPRERRLAKRSRAGVWVFGVSVGLLLLDIAHKQ